ncbi:RNA polymerase II-associated protein 1-like [Homalodisca vitripennis]|uniref:RNA polymerase II-associated protein 1-like n=1 Tax=Homalodisca vitripennis TaxID=197043 RepID=UPI001EEBAD7D|nr:RNA polymerase II-associated protein 1-like [Homalodisca vitripennis]XP_046675795.1 RNA polymerase II-associated protein 1-like [Homalodisca vitripennis]
MATPKKQSIFAQRMQNAKKLKSQDNRNVAAVSSGAPNFQVEAACFGEKSNIVHGPDAGIIHEENVKRLASMSPSEIEEERNKLIANLDPSIVDFLRSRKTTKVNSNQTKRHDPTPSSCSMEISDVPVVTQTPVAELVNKYPHMDVLEPDKLEWMQEVPPPQPPAPGCPYSARFNFDGELMPYTNDTKTDGLYHHGEEPDRPGYTLQELMQLSRSSMLQQRITAISTLANIFHKASDYDYCLERPLLPQLLNSELYLLLRFTLDDPVRSVVSAAIAAIANLLVNVKDEGCLDRLLGTLPGLFQPSFYVHLDLKPSELNELKDTELLKVDVIRGALRTHLLPRFRYILDKLDPEPVEISHIMRCLTRIVRHSHEAAFSISRAPGLLDAVRRLLNKQPPVACSESMKLFRVMACQSRGLAEYLVETHSLVEPIQRFIAGDRDETTMSLALESFYTWQTLLSYHLTTSNVPMFMPVIQRLLVGYAENISLDSAGGDLAHATALVYWIVRVLRVDLSCAQCLLPAFQLCALKWLSQATTISPLQWAANTLLGAVLHAVAVLITLQGLKNVEIEQKVGLFFRSDNFIHTTQRLRKYSWLMEGEKSPSVVDSLPCLGSVPPIIYDDSPLPLIMGLTVYLNAVRSPQLSEALVTAEGVQRYLEVVTGEIRTTTAHWFARQELIFVQTLLQVHLHIQNPVKNSLVHQAALFLSTSIHADDRYMLANLFDQFVFNKKFFSSEISDLPEQLQSLQIGQDLNQATLSTPSQLASSRRTKLLNEALDSLETISLCYKREFGLEGLRLSSPFPALTGSHCGTDPALPSDWHFLPIVHLHNIDGKREDAKCVAVSCLQWSLVLECMRPRFVANLSVASRFCRLACVLLAGSDLFRDTQEWLEEVLQALLVHNEHINFDEPIPGLKSFYDFYRQILEQFVGVSYGDQLFGRFVLIPLQQQHNIKLRKLIWCELGAALRFLSTPVSQVPLIKYLEPCETDPDLLFIYLSALAQGRVKETFCPVLYRVAVHHVCTYISRYPDLPATRRLAQMVQALGNQELKSLLMNYHVSK